MLAPTPATAFLHTNPPYRAEHVGSLLRPPQLLEKRTAFQESQCSADELRAAEDEAIAAALKLQQEVGLHTWTDGVKTEYRYFCPAMAFIIHLA